MKIKQLSFSILGWIWTIVKVLLLVFLMFLGYTQLMDYRPSDKKPLELRGQKNTLENVKGPFSILTWNIGYGGLGEDMDFFYDGGEMVRPTQIQQKRYLKGITDFLVNHSADIFLLQEIDRHSERSYQYNQVHHIIDTLKGYSGIFAKNYDVPFVPLPVTSPMGKVDAGMLTLSKLRPMMSFRYALPQSHSWPMSLFMLDRAVIFSTYPLPGRKNLVVMNIHNSAYADDKEAREKELEVIEKLANEAYKKGHYVVIGGDWNQNPPDFQADAIPNGREVGFTLSEDYISEHWQWVYDKDSPTNRSLEKSYSKDSPTTIIDFFRVSPNITVEQVEVLEQNFKFSDHEPVYLKIRLN